ncbi:hypothetical protein EJV47_13745 [Hymenobacter gummosus]|uniref:NTF2 fold domain-containing protein n=1 Tax=Hymenobacter gummosus TaxID=1776032 RepID=A0A431U1X1_9BACT|nr:YbbC/YhhH family protein [Hymenobacter gummosus]RTQ49204.1 hypothetical protein EJV47_13745 [Hymenobacter gummosus]
MRLLICLSGLLLLSASACGQQHLRSTHAQLKELLKETLKEPVERRVLVRPVIPDSTTAVAVAEALTFDIYGDKQIRRQKPYQVALIDGYWVVTGSLPVGHVGGAFEVILDAKDGRVLRLAHGK